MLNELIDDIGDSKFSLIVDESTGISPLKYLCLCVKYFSKSRTKIFTDYLGIIALENATAKVLYDSVIEFLSGLGLSESNVIGLGTDGGTNLRAKYNSLYAYL